MKTYNGYTAAEVQEMERDGTIPSHVLVNYINGDYDGSDSDFDDETEDDDY